MNNDKANSETQMSTSLDAPTVPSIWTILSPLGAAVCAGVAGYEAFHLRPGLWWALGAAIFILIGFLTRNASPSLTQHTSVEQSKSEQSESANNSPVKQTPFRFAHTWKYAVLILVVGVVAVAIFWLNKEQVAIVKPILKAITVNYLHEGNEDIICLVHLGDATSQSFNNKDEYQLKKQVCAAETIEALRNGTVIESHLIANRLTEFFAGVRVDPALPVQVLVADVTQLQEPLKTQLTALLPEIYRAKFNAFDVALASKRINDVAKTLPRLETLLPHQRQALFALGLYQSLATVPGKTEANLTQEKLDTYNKKFSIAVQTGNPPALAKALLNLINDINTPATYSTFTGGYTESDYFMANRSCDLPYAQFLDSQNIESKSQHIIHLLEIIGHAQYPNLDSSFARDTFSDADNSLGLPDKNKLDQCLELAKFYAKNVHDFNAPEQFVTNNYDKLYGIVQGGIREWRFRDWKRKGSDDRVSDSTVHGDPAILINAAVEVLREQPPSYEQFCAWAASFHAYTYLVREPESSMASAILKLPTQWQNAKTVFRSSKELQPERDCDLSDIFSRTNEFTDPVVGVRLMNKALKNVGIPCQGTFAAKNNTTTFTCTVKTVPWPTPETITANFTR